MGKRILLYTFVLILFVLVYSANAAILKGSVYDFNLEKLNNVIVKVNSEPPQQFIVKDGTYSFELAEGKYDISAKYYEDNILIYEVGEVINIKQDGEFIFDLILFPSMEEDEKLFEDIELDVSDISEKEAGRWWIWLVFGGVIILFVVLLYTLHFRKSQKGAQTKSEESAEEGVKQVIQTTEPQTTEPDEYYNKILEMLKKHKRLTQKEIRKEMPLSEAKISLIISEMEHKGVIEKIKKGRGNIIVLKK